jgi:hypothetical protein
MDIIMNFIALGVIAEIDNYYSNSLGNHKIKLLIEEANLPIIENKAK